MVEVRKEDIKKAIYFISNLTQLQGKRPMQGALTSKADYMGGILDRWINIIPEGIMMNKVILPEITGDESVKIITDYYDYDPKTVGIAPDVIGINVDGKTIPFVVFNEGWQEVDGMPQIEFKTFKKAQKLLSLRNQRYDDKFLIMAETDFRVDYLVPLLEDEFFSDDIYNELHMDDDVFIVSNKNGGILQPRRIDNSSDVIGYLELLVITTGAKFMDLANKCPGGVSPEHVGDIEEKKAMRVDDNPICALLDLCSLRSNNIYSFNDEWYKVTEASGKLIRDPGKIKTLDVYVENISAINVTKINKGNIRIKTTDKCKVADVELSANKVYSIELKRPFDRSGSRDPEYFILKSSLPLIPDLSEELTKQLSEVIETARR